MSKVRLGDVAIEVRETSKCPEGLPVVGLEHLLPSEITLTQWSDTSDNTFNKLFHKGQILFGRRRAYLKKAAVAPFDGVCSGDITVIAAKPERLLTELLPFIISNDAFFDYAMEKSAGSLSPRVKWAQLAEYEFDLPELEEQQKLANLLWAMERTRKAYQDLLIQADELVKSQFVEMFGDVITNSQNWPMRPLAAIAETRLGKMVDAKKQTGEHRHPYIANFNVQWFRFDFSELREMDFLPEDQQEFELQEGDLLVCEGGEVGRCAIWHNEIEGCYFQKAVHRIRCNKQYLVPGYLAYWFKHHSDFNQFEDIVGGKTSIAHLPGVKLKALQIPLPPIERQQSFCALCDQTDKSKLAIRQALESLEKSRSAIMTKVFG